MILKYLKAKIVFFYKTSVFWSFFVYDTDILRVIVHRFLFYKYHPAMTCAANAIEC